MRQLDEIKDSLISDILANQPNADITDGSLIRDLMVDPQSIQIYFLEERIDYVKLLSSFITNAENITKEDLDDIGANYNITRAKPLPSTGVITFRTKSLPQKDIRIGNQDGTGGISVQTLNIQDGIAINFLTTETVYMKTNAAYNSESGYYEVSAPIQSVSSGIETNVAIGTIIKLGQIITGIDSCYNYIATTGGTDEENNKDYASDISVIIQGGNQNTYNGLLKLIDNYDGVIDYKIYHPNSDTYSTDSGYVFIFIRGNQLSSTSENIIYSNSIKYYGLRYKPINSIVSVNALVKNKNTILQENISYYLYKDTTSINSYSSNSGDGIEFILSNNILPDPNSVFTVNYTYNILINNIQNTINQAIKDLLILGNFIVKEATGINVILSSDIKLKYQYNNVNIQNEILSGIQNYLSKFEINSIIKQSDVYNFIYNTYQNYIEAMNYPFNIFKREDDNINTVVENIQLNYNEYIDINTSTITINWK